MFLTSVLGLSFVGIFAPELGKIVDASPWQSRLIAGLALLLLLFVIAGYRLAFRIQQAETLRLVVTTDKATSADSGDIWLRLKVRNPTEKPIPGCYGRLCEMRGMLSDGTPCANVVGGEPLPLPQDGHRYPWQEHGGGIELSRTIPARSHDYLDILVRGKYEVVWKTVGVIFHEGRISAKQTNFPICGPISYEVIIQVGSEATQLKPTFIRARLFPDEERWGGEDVPYPSVSWTGMHSPNR